MPQSRLEKRPKGLSHPKPGTNDSDHTPEPHHPRRPDDDGANTIQRLTPHQRLLRSATPPPLNTPLPDPSPMQISDSPPQHNRPSSATPPPTGRDDHSLAPSAARPDAPPRNVDDASTTPAQHPKAPRPYAPQIAETRDDNTAAVAAQQAYPTAVSYVHAPPHDAINAHYMHAPPPTHAHAHAHAYAWHPAQQQCQNAALHHQSHHQVAHRAYAYPVHHSMMQPLSHVPLAQFGHIQPSIWSPLHPHLHRHHHPGNPAPYPAPVPMQVQDVQQAHFTHYFQAQPPPVPNTNAHSLPPNNFEGQGSGRSHHTSTPYGVQRAPAADANIEKAARFVPNMSAGEGPQSLENVAETRVTKATVQNNQEKRDDFGRQPAPADQFQARGSSSMRNQDGKKPSAPPDIQEQVQKLDGKDNSASNKAPSSRHQAGSSKRPRDKQGAQPIRKSRKPYTITKNRENWSEKEHLLFVEALQLYNRDWKRIEAHIGTKTVLQIRSHAQKHFGKVTKYKTGEYIPPARPKRRASQPYPRSRGTANAKGSTSNGDPGKAKSRQDRNTVTTGSAIVSDSGAGSSDNGNVSANGGGNGKSISGGSSDGGRNGVSERPPSRQRSVDRCSDSLPPVKREQNAGSQNSAQDNPASNCNQPKSDVPSASGSFDAGTSPPVACLNMPVRPAPLPGSYEHYYFNVVRPNGLPYGTGFYQGNHYPAHHPQYAWHDQACRQHNCYHGHGGVRYSEIPAGNHLPASHCLDPQTGQVRNGARPLHPSAAEQPWSSMDGNSDIKDVRRVNGIAERRHDGAAAADTPLVVLSNCVDMVARNSADKPAPGWATAAAARRAHRARVIRERKRGVQNGKHGDNVADAKGKENAVADNRTRDAMGQKNDGIGRSEKDSAMPPNRSNQEEHRRERHADVLISPADGCNEAGVVDVGSDEAVAGFSGSDRQESGSDGATGGSTGGSRTPENSEEDPNSSNDGSGDDGRRNTRGSSPADPTSSGSREDTPSVPETVGSQNLSSANGTPPASRETTPSDNADAAAADGAGGGGGSSKGRNGTEKKSSSDGGAAKMTRSPKAKRNASNSANDTIMVAAKMLSNYTADNNRNGGGGGVGNGVPVGKNPKSQIGNLLNCEPCASFRMEAAGGHQDQKRNRSAQDRACEEERVAGGPGYEGVEEPNSQRRKHSVSQVVGNINK